MKTETVVTFPDRVIPGTRYMVICRVVSRHDLVGLIGTDYPTYWVSMFVERVVECGIFFFHFRDGGPLGSLGSLKSASRLAISCRQLTLRLQVSKSANGTYRYFVVVKFCRLAALVIWYR